MAATYTKLRSGDWGIRVQGSVEPGATVTVTKKSGESKSETVARVLWSGDGISLCAISRSSSTHASARNWDPNKFNGYGARKGGYRRACVNDGECSSFGDGHNCGGYDCDGY